MKHPHPSRRRFLGTGLAAGALPLAPHIANGAAKKLNLGIIGSGGRGRANMGGVAKRANLYAFCDTNGNVLEALRPKHPDAKFFQDWRELVADPKIDGVVISTADHHHALAAVAAMRAGKHVYCEKPLGHTVKEARVMQEEYLKRRGQFATQMGTQIHANNNYRRSVELVQGGAIGPVREVHVWCNRGIRPVNPVVLPEEPIPEGFAWDVWLGPAPDRPYNTGYWKGGNLNWNRRWDFGNGALGDMGSHLIDLAYWALELKRPNSVASAGPEPDEHAAPPWQEITWEHAKRGDGPHQQALKVIWYHGGEGMQRRAAKLQPKVGEDTQINKWGIGLCFVGDDGVLTTDYGKHVLSPSETFQDFKRPEAGIPASKGHYNEWLDACEGGTESLCNFEYSGMLIEHNLLGTVAHRAGKKLDWDAEAFKVTNEEGANQYVSKTYREGWSL